MYSHKRATAYVVLVGVLTLISVFSCSKKQGSKPIEPPKLALLSNHGAPGKTVQASVTGINISNGSVFIMFDTIPAPIFAIEDQKFSFLVPLLRAGQFKVFVQDTLGATSTTVTFTVDQQPATGQPPGKITADMLSSTIELVDVATSTGAKLRQLGILTPTDSSVLSQDISRITTLLSTMQSDFVDLPDSVKTMVDAFLYSAGLSEILNTQKSNSPVGKCVSDLEIMLATSTPYDTFRVLVALDAFSMVLSDLKAGLTVSAVAILIATGGTGSAASGAIAAVCFGISVVDNIIDGALPTDLNRLQVSFIPQNGPELNVGEKANVKVVGWFSTQKSPEDATVDVILGGLFYGINVNLGKHLKGVIENLSLKFAQAMSVSLDDVITNVRQVTLPYPVSVDINFYQKDFDQIMEATGMTIFGPGVAVALDLVSFILPDFEVVPLSFSTNAVSYNASSNQVTALTTGTLNSTNVSMDAWTCKSLCSGFLSFLCFGAEWPKVIEHDQHTVQAITIAQAGDTTRPSPITNLEVTSVTSNSVTLEWTAPGDDGHTGTASQYDIRYSTSNITESNWGSADTCSDEPTPKVVGSSESYTVNGLNPDTKYFFAIKTADEVPNWSQISNVVSDTTMQSTSWFQGPFNYGVGDNPRSVFCADLDNDGDLDLAVANDVSDNVSIIKNNGNGTFETAVNYGAGNGPWSVFCADLDNDGDLDLATANDWSNNVSILKNNGDGTFQTAVNYGVGTYPRSVFCADLDNDGDLDLAVANHYYSNVSILKNNGDGTFKSKVDYNVGTNSGSSPQCVYCADLDNDGDLDLATANYGSSNVSILKNNGDGTFQTAVNYGVGLDPYSVFCADLDNDGDLDLAVANYLSDNVSILKNNGDGTFASKVNYGVGTYPNSVFCADLDNDGDLDLAVANANSNNVSILKNNGDGTFASKVNYGVGDFPWSVFCADLDGDTDLDLAVPNVHSNSVSILLNQTK